MGDRYGYVRVSTKEQNEDRQMIAMSGVQVPERNIYVDKQSGKDFNRPMYRKLLTTCSISRASTVWAGTTGRCWSSGES